MGFLLGLIAIAGTFAIPIVAIALTHRGKFQKDKNKELELRKQILELEIKKQNDNIRLLEEENRKYDRIIDGGS